MGGCLRGLFERGASIASLPLLTLAILTGCSDTPKLVHVRRTAEEPVVAPALAPANRIIAYYFHGTVRCETCLRIEKQANELINTRFVADVASERLVFKAVNYDVPENAHFSHDYKLPGPSLVLVRQERGKDLDWKLLGQTWDFVQIPPKLDQYIEEEITRFLEGDRQSAVRTESAGSIAPKEVGSFSEVENHAREMNAVFVLLPAKDQAPTAETLAAVNGARADLEARFDIKVGFYSLAPGSRNYRQMCAEAGAPAVVAIVKTGVKRTISGELTKEKVLDGFIGAVAAGGCCPLGYPGEK